MFVIWRALNRSHQVMEICSRGVERRLKRLREEEMQMRTAVTFEVYGRPLEMAEAFKYLGRALTTSDDNWLLVVKNLSKSWMR